MKKSVLVLICVALCLFAFTGGLMAADQLDPIPALDVSPQNVPLLGAGEGDENDNFIVVPQIPGANGSITELEVSGDNITVDQDKTAVTLDESAKTVFIDLVVADTAADDAVITMEITMAYQSNQFVNVVFGAQDTNYSSIGTYAHPNVSKTATFTLADGRFAGKFGINNSSASLGAYYVVTIRKAGDNNHFPELTGDSTKKDFATVGTPYTIDVASLFTDPDGDELTYTMKKNGGEAEAVNASYTYTPEAAGIDTFVFTARDTKLPSPSYTLSVYCLDATAARYDVSGLRSTRSDNWVTELAISGYEVKRLKTPGVSDSAHTLEIWLDPSVPDDAELTLMITGVSNPENGDLFFRSWAHTATDTVGSVIAPASSGGQFNPPTATITLKLDGGRFYNRAIMIYGNSNTLTRQYYVTVKKATQEELDANEAPAIQSGYTDGETKEVKVGTETTFDLSSIFRDPDSDQMTYSVKIDDGEERVLSYPEWSRYKYTATSASAHTLTFAADDNRGGKTSYTVEYIGYTPVQIPVTISPDTVNGGSSNHEGKITSMTVFGAAQTKAEVFSESIEPTGASQPVTRGVLEFALAPGTDPNGTFYADLTIGMRSGSVGSIAQVNSKDDDKGALTYSGNSIACTLANGELSKEFVLRWNGYAGYDKYYLVKAHIATEREWANSRPIRKANINATNRLNRVVDTLDSTVNNNRYNVNLDNIFMDADDEPLSYTVTVNGVTSDVAGSVFYSDPYTPDDEGTFTYVFRAKDEFLSSNDTYTVTVDVSVNEHRPDLTEGMAPNNEMYWVTAEPLTLDLAEAFVDPDAGDTLRYTVAVAKDGGEATEPIAAAEQFSYSFTEAGKYVLTFNAIDSTNFESIRKFALTVTVGVVGENAVKIEGDPNGVKYLSFYIAGGADNGKPANGITVEEIETNEDNTSSAFTFAVPDGITATQFRVGLCREQSPKVLPGISSRSDGNAFYPNLNATLEAMSFNLSSNYLSGRNAAYYCTEVKGDNINNGYIVAHTYSVKSAYVQHENNRAPVVKEGLDDPGSATAYQGEAYTPTPANYFTDPDGDAMTYTMSVDGGEERAIGGLTYEETGSHELKFYATDYSGAKSEAYTVNLNVLAATTIPVHCQQAPGSTFDTWLTGFTVKGANVGLCEWLEGAGGEGHTDVNDLRHEVNVRLSGIAADGTIALSYTTFSTMNITHLMNHSGNVPSLQLEDGKGTVTYKMTRIANVAVYGFNRTYVINFLTNPDNTAPTVKEGLEERATVLQGNDYEPDFGEWFADADEDDALSYYVKIDDQKEQAVDADYKVSLTELGDHKVIFTAKDTWGAKVSHEMTISVVDPAGYHVDINVPADITPVFYGVDDEGNLSEDSLDYADSDGENGFNVYDVTVPHDYAAVSVGDIDEELGSVIVAAKDGEGSPLTEAISVRPVSVIVTNVVDGENLTAEQLEVTVTAQDGSEVPAGIDETDGDGAPLFHYLLAAGEDEYTFTVKAKGDLASRYNEASVSQAVATDSADAVEVKISLEPTDAEKDRLAAKEVEDAIDALGDDPAEADVTAAREAYNALTDAQKELVPNEDKLKAAEDALAKAAADAAAAKAVDDAIAALPAAADITVDDKDDIEAAEAAYNALTADQKALVEKKDVLDEAKEALAAAEAAAEKAAADAAAAKAVDDAIAALPAAADITVDDKDDIDAAQAAYDKLTDDQKALVEKKDVLDEAKEALAAAEAAAEKAAADAVAAKAVDDAIAALPAAADITVDDKDDIEAAQAAYDKLTDDQKALVENKAALDEAKDALAAAEKAAADEAAKQAADKAAAKAVDDAIAALPAAADITVDDKDDIEAAQAAYDALTADQKALVENKAALDEAKDALAAAEKAAEDAAKQAAEKAAADKAAAKAVDDAIAALPAAADITVDDKDDIDAAQAAYDKLTDDQKALVENKAALDGAKAALEAAEKAADEAAKQAAADAAAAKAVTDQIAALPAAAQATAADEPAVQAARAAYEKLTDAQKALVPNEDQLKAAEKAVADAKKAAEDKAAKDAADKAAADAVKARIAALPAEVTLDDEAAVAAARSAFDALTDDQKALVDNEAALKAAEAKLAELKNRPAENTFVDVKEGAFYYDAVAWAVANGITNGTDATHFSPAGECTRGQVVTFLWRAAGSPEPTSADNPFADVKEGKFYYNAVLWAVENGITNGTDATHFSPDATCTRGQVVTFQWRAAGSPAPQGSNNPFVDVKAGAFYENAVLWAVANGITNGTDATHFSPADTCTRGQVVTFLYRAK